MSTQPILLAYKGKYWTSGELRVKVRSFTEPDREVPLAARITATPDVLDFAMGDDPKEVTARVTVKAGADLPTSDRVLIKVVADPATEAAMTATAAAGMLPPGVSLPRPFKSMTADVEVRLFPYEVELTDENGSSGPDFPVDLDGSSRVRVRARVYRVAADGTRQSEITPISGDLVGHPEGQGIAIASQSDGNGFVITATSSELKLGEAPPAVRVAFKVNVPSGRRFTEHVTFQPRPVRAELTCDKKTVGVSVASALESPRLTLSVTTAEGRPVKTAYRLECPLGSLSPAAGQLDEAGHALSHYHPPTPKAASESPGAWPRTIAVKALLGPKGVEGASCELSLTFQRSLKLVVEKAGFARLEKEVEMSGPGPCNLRLVARARTEEVAVAHATVSCNESAPAISNSEGRCSLAVGTGGAFELGQLTLELEPAMANLQKRVVDGLREGAGQGAPSDYTNAQTSLNELVEKDLVVRLAREKPDTYEITSRVMLALAGSVKVMNLARTCFGRRFDRVQTGLKNALDALLSAMWEIWGGAVFTALLTGLLKTLAGAAMAVGRLVGGRLLGWSVTAVTRTVGAMKVTFETAYTRLASKVSSLFRQSRVPLTLQQRLSTNPATGPVPMNPGSLASALKAELQSALSVLIGKISSLKDAVRLVQTELSSHATAVRELENLIARNKGVPGTSLGDLEARLVALQARAAPLQERLARASGELQKAELELVDKQARNRALGMVADELDTLVNLVAGLLNVTYNILGAMILGIIACLLSMLQRALLRAGVASVVLERLGQILEDLVGNLLCDLGSKEGTARGTTATEKIRKQLLALQRQMAGPVLATTYEKLKDWPEIDKDRFHSAVQGYYEGVERNELLTAEREIYADFGADMLDWLEWLILWFSRLGVLLAGLVALFASAGTATPAVWAFEAEANLVIENLHKWYKGLKAVCSGMSAMSVMAITAGVVLPAFVEYTITLFDEPGLRDQAAVPLSFDSRLLDPDIVSETVL